MSGRTLLPHTQREDETLNFVARVTHSENKARNEIICERANREFFYSFISPPHLSILFISCYIHSTVDVAPTITAVPPTLI